MQLALLSSSLLIGAAHAFEPDHLAAMGSLAIERSGWKKLAVRGALWGLGHTLTLFVLSMAVIAFGMTLGSQSRAMLETFVGVMLFLLGLQLLARALGFKVHRHDHSHGTGGGHSHVHLHIERGHDHSASKSSHLHRLSIDWKPLTIGMVHGAAGSGALIVLVAAVTREATTAGFYVLAFGFGSVAGMAMASIAASLPLSLLARHAKQSLTAVKVAMGLFAAGLGASIIGANADLG
jgi:sulfite exporter TauE/SafE